LYTSFFNNRPRRRNASRAIIRILNAVARTPVCRPRRYVSRLYLVATVFVSRPVPLNEHRVPLFQRTENGRGGEHHRRSVSFEILSDGGARRVGTIQRHWRRENVGRNAKSEAVVAVGCNSRSPPHSITSRTIRSPFRIRSFVRHSRKLPSVSELRSRTIQDGRVCHRNRSLGNCFESKRLSVEFYKTRSVISAQIGLSEKNETTVPCIVYPSLASTSV